MSRLGKILKKKKITNRELQRLLYLKHGVVFADGRISNIVNLRTPNYTIKTALLIADVLDVKVDDICEKLKPKKVGKKIKDEDEVSI